MTREEAAIDYCLFIGNTSLDEVDAFKAGAEWEHKRLVEKACEWLLNNAHLYVYAITKEKRALMFDNFKKAMEN